jgi:alkanesulfonate monooxygenase SsuD/methylene tetrahydromethanopterin reductase-like flavin-dependent oxidoreductase (luciferase family)
MDAWWMCEVPYPHVPKAVLDEADSVRASLPSRYCDPRVAADLFEEAIDEYLLCDEMGLNVCATEHHAGINSLLGANPMLVGILARQTRNARILSLGTLVSLRREPVRVAEEYATADVISRGRLELGFVKSGGTEMASANVNPINNIERYWEAIDLIAKALTHQDGPFSWEGKHFTHRHVNIWPRPWQKQLRMWAATGDPHTAAEVGRRGMVHTLVLRGPEGTRRAYAAYRNARAEAGLPPASSENFAYSAFVCVGDTEEEGRRVGEKLLWFLNTSLKSAPQYARLLPGVAPPHVAGQAWRTRPKPTDGSGLVNAEKGVATASENARKLVSITVDEAMAQGILFAGSPDGVFAQIKQFYDDVGGFGHLTMIGRTGFMTHAESEKSIRLFSKEVLPRLRAIKHVAGDSTVRESSA